MEFLDADISELLSNTTTSEDSSCTPSDKETEDMLHDDLNWITGDRADGHTIMSNVSSDDNDDNGMLSDNEFDTTDNETEDTPSASFHLQVFTKLK